MRWVRRLAGGSRSLTSRSGFFCPDRIKLWDTLCGVQLSAPSQYPLFASIRTENSSLLKLLPLLPLLQLIMRLKQNALGGIPVNAGVGDGNAVLELAVVSWYFLVAFFKVTFNHQA